MALPKPFGRLPPASKARAIHLRSFIAIRVPLGTLMQRARYSPMFPAHERGINDGDFI